MACTASQWLDRNTADPAVGPISPWRRSSSAQRVGPPEVGGVVARGEERAHRRRHGQRVRHRPARQGHRLVEHRHALVDPSALDVGQPTVGERLRLELDVAEAASPVEGQLGGRQQLGRDRRPRSPSRRPPPSPARCTAARRRRGGGRGRTTPGSPAGCRGSVAIMSPRRADATAARRLSPAAVSSRTAVDRWARMPSTSKRANASSARARAASPAASRSAVTGPAWHRATVPAVATDGTLTAADLVARMVALQPLVAARAATGRAAAAPRRRGARRAPRQRRVPPLRAPPLRRAAARCRRLRGHRAAARRGLRIDRVGHVVPHGAQPDPVAVPGAHPGRGVRVAAVRDGAGRSVPARRGRAGRGRLPRQRAVELRQRRPPQRLGDGDGAHRRGRAARHAVGAGAHRGRRGARRVARRRHGGDGQRRLLDGRGLRPRPPHAPDERDGRRHVAGGPTARAGPDVRPADDAVPRHDRGAADPRRGEGRPAAVHRAARRPG